MVYSYQYAINFVVALTKLAIVKGVIGRNKIPPEKLKDMKIKVFNAINTFLIITMFVQLEINNKFSFVFSKVSSDEARFCINYSSDHGLRVSSYAIVLIVLSYIEAVFYLYELKKHLAKSVPNTAERNKSGTPKNK